MHLKRKETKLFHPIFVNLSLKMKKKSQVVDGLAAVWMTSALPL